MGSAAAQCLAFGANFLFVWRWSKRHYDPGFRLGALGVILLICAIAYVFANILFHPHDMVSDIAYKSAVYVVASVIIGAVTLREVNKLNPQIYATIQGIARRFKVGALVR
jgi:hypothetical protein